MVQDPVAQHLESRTEDKSQEDIAFTLEGAAASSVDSVGTTDPVHDFETLVRDGKTDVAFQSLPQAVYSLVDNSLGNRCCNIPTFSSERRAKYQQLQSVKQHEKSS